MFLATEVTAPSVYSNFDIVMLLFTIIIAWGFVRLIRSPERNLFAIGFTGVSLLVFLASDIFMFEAYIKAMN